MNKITGILSIALALGSNNLFAMHIAKPFGCYSGGFAYNGFSLGLTPSDPTLFTLKYSGQYLFFPFKELGLDLKEAGGVTGEASMEIPKANCSQEGDDFTTICELGGDHELYIKASFPIQEKRVRISKVTFDVSRKVGNLKAVWGFDFQGKHYKAKLYNNADFCWFSHSP